MAHSIRLLMCASRREERSSWNDDTTIEDTRHDKGFSLVELLIVIVILGILATVVVFAVTGISTGARPALASPTCTSCRPPKRRTTPATPTPGCTATSRNSRHAGLIHDVSPNFTITVGPGTGAAASYTITGNAGDCFGING